MSDPAFVRKQGDTLDKLRMQCFDANGPVDISGLPSELRLSAAGKTTVILGSVIADDPTLPGPDSGIGWWEYHWKLTDPQEPGNYGVEVTFTFGSDPRTFPTVGQYPVLITGRG